MVSTNTKILKSSDFEEYQYTKKIVNKAFVEAETIIKKAELVKQKAEENVKKMMLDAEQIHRQAYKKGYDEGIREAKSEYLEHTISFVSQSLKYLKNLENDVVDMVTSSVRNIISSYEPDQALCEYIKSYINNIVTEKQIVLRVSPGTSRVLNKRVSDLSLNFNPGSLLIVPDIRLENHEVVIESEFGTESVDLEGKLSNLTHSFSLLMSGHE